MNCPEGHVPSTTVKKNEGRASVKMLNECDLDNSIAVILDRVVSVDLCVVSLRHPEFGTADLDNVECNRR